MNIVPNRTYPLDHAPRKAVAASQGTRFITRGAGAALRSILVIALSALLFAALSSSIPLPAMAETYMGGAILKNETPIEQVTNSYLEAKAELDAVAAQLAELEAQIPIQQQKSDHAIKERYKHQSDTDAFLDVLFSATSLDDLLKQTEYIERVSGSQLAEVNRLKDMKAEVERLKAEMEERMAPIEAQLNSLKGERASRQATGIAKSQGQAASLGGAASVGVAHDGGKQPDDYREAATTDGGALNDGADWYADRDEFIEHWAARIDAYLAGSALEGQGVNFAKAAWKYNIDPRWSAAISNTESSKGAVCIRPHNAWGWGADDRDPYNLALEWDSWEEAIDAHAKGLSEGYGYTISMLGARAYCPNTWQSWYNKTLGQMSTI